jgi:hypothetical protein
VDGVCIGLTSSSRVTFAENLPVQARRANRPATSVLSDWRDETAEALRLTRAWVPIWRGCDLVLAGLFLVARGPGPTEVPDYGTAADRLLVATPAGQLAASAVVVTTLPGVDPKPAPQRLPDRHDPRPYMACGGGGGWVKRSRCRLVAWGNACRQGDPDAGLQPRPEGPFCSPSPKRLIRRSVRSLALFTAPGSWRQDGSQAGHDAVGQWSR